ncbi:glycosyltransferase family 2 protein [Pseudomonas sp. MH9.2]|uniref:glycosyltransferase family 2 protein n=1 Tax=Pseudomonas sp. MH9.2 TaxID=3048629 RepID=UPI002AC926D4|nr:glycosyltransferase family 2 protein [Pseudomonas sp. MH9.2]MEB0029009.1 glycosyltransferase family 2 protein [Pseudomonas sp. MH9.2]WPX70526.1 glycosyltransferase family 2 protein [Pseudomonas sp. MH9.2]
MKGVAAVVVGYNPDIQVLDSLLASLVDQVDLLVLVDNGGASLFLESSPTIRDRIRYIPLGENKGLGFALNIGFSCAIDEGNDYVVTFDQDSHAQSDLISTLHQAMCKAKLMDGNAIAVSPTFFDRRDGKQIKFPFYSSSSGAIRAIFQSDDEHGLVKADALITSGMLVDTRAWKKGIKYDDGMFVDFTDTEWCFRVRDRGFSLYGCLKVEMGHALSDAPPVKILGLSFFRYSPVRRYFFFRNTVAVCRMKHTPGCWKRRMIMALMLRFAVNLLIDTDRAKSLRMMVRGIRHGLKTSLGPVH